MNVQNNFWATSQKSPVLKQRKCKYQFITCCRFPSLFSSIFVKVQVLSLDVFANKIWSFIILKTFYLLKSIEIVWHSISVKEGSQMSTFYLKKKKKRREKRDLQFNHWDQFRFTQSPFGKCSVSESDQSLHHVPHVFPQTALGHRPRNLHLRHLQHPQNERRGQTVLDNKLTHLHNWSVSCWRRVLPDSSDWVHTNSLPAGISRDDDIKQNAVWSPESSTRNTKLATDEMFQYPYTFGYEASNNRRAKTYD